MNGSPRLRLEIAAEVCAILFLTFNLLWNLFNREGSSYLLFLSVFLALAVCVYSVIRHWDGLRQYGVRLDNLAESLRACFLPLAVIVLACVAFAVITHTPLKMPQLKLFIQFPGAGLLQQLIFQGFFFTRYEIIFRNRRLAVFFSALTFALFHLPNRELTVVTFFGGLYLAAFFARYRNVFAAALIHGAISLALTFTLEPAGILKTFKVGPQPLGPIRHLIAERWEPGAEVAYFVPSPGIPSSFESAFEPSRPVESREDLETFLAPSGALRFAVVPKEVYDSLLPQMTVPSYIWKDSLVWLRKFPHRRTRTLKCILTLNFKQLHEYYRDRVLLIANRPPPV